MNKALLRSATEHASEFPVLYVDDEPNNLLVFQAEYSDEFSIRTVGSGPAALEILREHHFPILLADQRMPHMTGIELCTIVKQRYPHILRVLVTAYSDQQTAIDAINHGGVIRYLVKPWRNDEVRQVLREAVARAYLEQTVRRLRTAIVDGERMAGIVAAQARLLHDLSNPLSAICAVSQILQSMKERLKPSLSNATFERFACEFDTLSTTSRYVIELYEQAKFARTCPESTEQSSFAVATVLDTVTQLLQPKRPETPLLVLDCPEDMTMWASLTDISRILINLIGNAQQAIESAGIVNGEVRVEVYPSGDLTIIDVSDNGPGVAKELGEDIFAPFVTSRSDSGGSGLGLAICRDLAASNHGTIELAPTESGAKFRISIPSVKGESKTG